jgi:hypothetical protein
MDNVCVDLRWFGEYMEYFLLTLFLLLLCKLAYDYVKTTRREGFLMTSPARGKFLKEFISDGLVDHIDGGLKQDIITKEEHTKLYKYVGNLMCDRERLPSEKEETPIIKGSLADILRGALSRKQPV